ncbi:MAG: hypothetical protein JEZ09_04610 [Salinivirgaceae bacterium]|nr:hypothetical protein [Salinivirgaceae bacterium]
MILKLYKLLFNRNTFLIFAILIGLSFNDLAIVLKDYNIYILALVMTFSTSGISTSGLLPVSKSLKIMGTAVLLGYFIFSSVLLLLSWVLVKNEYLFYGLVVIAASPPGVAVIPFTHYLRGNMNYTMIGTLGAYLASIIIAPIIITVFSGSNLLQPMQIIVVMIKIIIIPFLLSRVLRQKSIYKAVEKFKGKIVDLGFALIIYTAVGLNREVFFSNFEVLATISLIFFISMFVLGYLYNRMAIYLKIPYSNRVSQNLLLTVKSSGFTASVSLALFGKEAAVPSAIMAVLVLVYLIYLSIRSKITYVDNTK